MAYHARMPRTCYLIDGHAQIFRAYYAPFPALSSPTGEPTKATHVFCQMLLSIMRDRKPDYLAMVLDVSDSTVFRREIYPQYKAQRDETPEDLPAQAERIVSIVEAIGIPVLRKEGFEADDILATIVRRHANADVQFYLVSKDKDLDQLLTPRVSLYDPGKDLVVTADGLFGLKGWTPAQAIDAQTLIGDTVDNVPGVRGIGEKTAAKLLQKYGTAAAVIEHAAELTPKQRENVLAFAPLAHITRQLVTLRDDVPIDFDLSAADVARFRWSAARPIFSSLGFRRLTEQVAALGGDEPESADAAGSGSAATTAPANPGGAAAAAGSTASGADAAGPAVARADDDQALEFPPRVAVEPHAPAAPPAATTAGGDAAAIRIDESLCRPDGGDYRLIDTPALLDDFVRELSRQVDFAVDTETTGVNPIDAEIVGLSFAWEVGRGCYIPVRSVFGAALDLAAVRERLAPILADERKRKVGHHIKFDQIVLQQAGMPVAGPLFDTMIAAFVLDPLQTSYKMDKLVAGLLRHEMIPITDLIGKGRDQLSMDQVPVERVAEYAAEDADYTWRMKVLFEPQLRASDRSGLFFDLEMPLTAVLTAMETNGIRVDVPFLQRMRSELQQRIAARAAQVHALVGRPFNLDSPKQLGEVLFDQLQFRVVRKTKTTRSTDAETLEALAAETGHALPGLILEYRELQKLLGTYVEALPAAVSRRTGRVHTSYHQTGAITGRLSSSEPNLQNIPVRTELGRQIRRAFVPRTADERLIVADYSQIELRVLAHFCQDEALIQAFTENRDVHAFVASQVNNVPLEAVTKEMRSRAKAVNFGIIYGQTAFGLAQGTGMSRTEAQAFIDDYFRRYPKIRGFIDQCIADARRDGYVRTIYGRRRPIPDIHSRNQGLRNQAERLSVNTVIQGSAADLIKVAMVKLHQRIVSEKLPLRMLLQVHDELVFEAPRSEAERMSAIVSEVMRTALPLSVPICVDVHTGENWLEAK